MWVSTLLIRWIGVVIVLGAAVYWFVTGIESAIIIGAGISLVGVNEVGNARLNELQARHDRERKANGTETSGRAPHL